MIGSGSDGQNDQVIATMVGPLDDRTHAYSEKTAADRAKLCKRYWAVVDGRSIGATSNHLTPYQVVHITFSLTVADSGKVKTASSTSAAFVP